jgi:hypothetical protein
LFPFRKESSPVPKHHRQKIFLQPTRGAVAPLDVVVQQVPRTAKKINSYFSFTGFVDVKVRRQMVIRIEPQGQALDLYAGDLAHPMLVSKSRLFETGHRLRY